MAGEKYVVAAADNPLQIAVRNILNPYGYNFLGNCSDAVTLLRMIRSYHPDFVIVDLALQVRDVKLAVETLDDEMLGACIVIGDYRNMELTHLMDKSKILSYCPKPPQREILLHTVELSLINYKRIYALDSKLKEVTENYETRKVVERAKWILMKKFSCSEEEAYERMRKKSMNNRLSMRAIADAVIFTDEIENG